MNSPTFDKILEPVTSYRSKTKLYDCYSIADKKNQKTLEELFKVTFAVAKTDYEYLIELVMVLKYRLWYWHTNRPESPYVSTYATYYNKVSEWAAENLEGEELRYYFSVSD